MKSENEIQDLLCADIQEVTAANITGAPSTISERAKSSGKILLLNDDDVVVANTGIEQRMRRTSAHWGQHLNITNFASFIRG